MKFYTEELKSKGSISLDEVFEGVTLLGSPQEFVKSVAPVEVQADALYQGGQILIEAVIKTKFQLICGRCLDVFDKKVHENIKQVFTTDENTIDFDYNIKETLILSLPLNAVCRENCLGLCSICGSNKNTNPCQCRTKSFSSKWDELDKIKFH